MIVHPERYVEAVSEAGTELFQFTLKHAITSIATFSKLRHLVCKAGWPSQPAHLFQHWNTIADIG